LTPGREVLSGNRTYYVDAANGNDANAGLSAGSGNALATIGEALARISRIDTAGHIVEIQLADGTYAQPAVTGPMAGGGDLTIRGNAGNAAAVIIQGTVYTGISVSGGARVILRDLTLATTAGGSLLSATGRSTVYFTNLRFTACSRFHIEASEGSLVSAIGNYSIVGGAGAHIYLTTGSLMTQANRTATLTGTPAFSSGFIVVSAVSAYSAWNQTWIGSATGVRYTVSENGVIKTFGKGATHFPGSVSGSAPTGGQYS
jgi:hypothetical protein